MPPREGMHAMSRLKPIAVFGLALAAAGCAAPQYHWIKPGVDAATFNKERAACVAYTDKEFNPYYDYGPPLGRNSWAQESMFRHMAAGDMFRDCMKRKGYKLVQGPAET